MVTLAPKNFGERAAVGAGATSGRQTTWTAPLAKLHSQPPQAPTLTKPSHEHFFQEQDPEEEPTMVMQLEELLLMSMFWPPTLSMTSLLLPDE